MDRVAMIPKGADSSTSDSQPAAVTGQWVQLFTDSRNFNSWTDGQYGTVLSRESRCNHPLSVLDDLVIVCARLDSRDASTPWHRRT